MNPLLPQDDQRNMTAAEYAERQRAHNELITKYQNQLQQASEAMGLGGGLPQMMANAHASQLNAAQAQNQAMGAGMPSKARYEIDGKPLIDDIE
jgi:hypothetical protein